MESTVTLDLSVLKKSAAVTEQSEPCITPGSIAARKIMWVVPICELLKMTGPPIHHQALKASHVLVRWEPGMLVTFVSHQWTSKKHPDPEGTQLAVLVQFLKNVAQGKISVGADMEAMLCLGVSTSMTSKQREALIKGYVWLDWFSVPQCVGEHEFCPDTQAAHLDAIARIPNFVRSCANFVVLCPNLASHDGSFLDYHSWQSRGWCRTEQMSHLLAKPDAMVIIIRSARQAYFSTVGLFALSFPVGLGKFSDSRDLAAVGEALTRILHSTLQSKETDLQRRRLLLSLLHHLLKGLPCSSSFDLDMRLTVLDNGEAFLRSFGFSSWHDNGIEGFGPLECAAASNNLVMVQHALTAGVCPNRKLAKPVRAAFLPKGASVLMMASRWGGAQVVEELLLARADPNLHDAGGLLPLTVASTCRDEITRITEIAKCLIKHRADPARLGGALNLSPLAGAIFCGSTELSKLYVENGAAAIVDCKTNVGVTHLMLAAMASGSVDIGKDLVRHGADLNATATPSGVYVLVTKACRALCAMGFSSTAARFFAETPGATALHYAAFYGSHELTHFLLEQGSDASIRNERGHTAADVALECGFVDLHRTLSKYSTDLHRLKADSDGSWKTFSFKSGAGEVTLAAPDQTIDCMNAMGHTFSVVQVKKPRRPLPAGQVPVAPILQLGPAGVTFSPSVQLTIPLLVFACARHRDFQVVVLEEEEEEWRPVQMTRFTACAAHVEMKTFCECTVLKTASDFRINSITVIPYVKKADAEGTYDGLVFVEYHPCCQACEDEAREWRKEATDLHRCPPPEYTARRLLEKLAAAIKLRLRPRSVSASAMESDIQFAEAPCAVMFERVTLAFNGNDPIKYAVEAGDDAHPDAWPSICTFEFKPPDSGTLRAFFGAFFQNCVKLPVSGLLLLLVGQLAYIWPYHVKCVFDWLSPYSSYLANLASILEVDLDPYRNILTEALLAVNTTFVAQGEL